MVWQATADLAKPQRQSPPSLRAEASSSSGFDEGYLDYQPGPCSPADGARLGNFHNQASTVDITSLRSISDSNEYAFSPRQYRRPGPSPTTASLIDSESHQAPTLSDGPCPIAPTSKLIARQSMTPSSRCKPVKKPKRKWSPEEDALIIELRGKGMKWEDVSKQLPGRSLISCRLHYQNYLERRGEWSEELKDRLAQLYERFKADMWANVAKEIAVPWRAVEAMHWQLGEQDMARRAGVVPFSLVSVNTEANRAGGQNSASHDHRAQSQLQPQGQGSVPRDTGVSPSHTLYGWSPQQSPEIPNPPSIASRREAAQTPTHSSVPEGRDMEYVMALKLAPIQAQGQTADPGYLPGIAEMAAGMALYGPQVRTPPNLCEPNPSGSYHSGYMQQAPMVYPSPEYSRVKRPASPEVIHPEAGYRRRMA